MSQITGIKAGQSASDDMFTFYREMDAKGRKTFWACFGGCALDAMDFMIYPLVIGTLIALWKMDAQTAGGIATVTLLCSSIGGWLAGFLADRIGRVRTMQITIAIFSAGSLLSAFAQDPLQLAIFRGLLGIGFGGEIAVAAVTLAEVVSGKNRGQAIGFYQGSYAVGWAAAVLTQALVFVWLPADFAWRVMFGIGALPALLIFFIRRSVDEPQVSAKAMSAEKPNFWAIFSPEHIRQTLTGVLLAIGAQGGFYALMTWMPQYLRAERGISVIGSTPYLLTLICGCFAGYVAGGWLSDRIGRRWTFVLYASCAAIAIYCYTHFALNDTLMMFLGFPLGFFAVGYYGPLMTALSEMFPTRLRGAGVGFTYNSGRAVGSLFPFLVGAVSAKMGLGDAISLFAIMSYGLIVVVALCMRETKGITFEA